jgi:hypothetical protein
VVTVKLPQLPEPIDYHVLHPRDDPQQLPGLHAQLLAEIKAGATIATWKDVPLIPELTPEQKLAALKTDADRIINLLQLEYDISEDDHHAELLDDLISWKRYRVQLEKDSSSATQPMRPTWIT